MLWHLEERHCKVFPFRSFAIPNLLTPSHWNAMLWLIFELNKCFVMPSLRSAFMLANCVNAIWYLTISQLWRQLPMLLCKFLSTGGKLLFLLAIWGLLGGGQARSDIGWCGLGIAYPAHWATVGPDFSLHHVHHQAHHWHHQHQWEKDVCEWGRRDGM